MRAKLEYININREPIDDFVSHRCYATDGKKNIKIVGHGKELKIDIFTTDEEFEKYIMNYFMEEEMPKNNLLEQVISISLSKNMTGKQKIAALNRLLKTETPTALGDTK